MKSFLTLAMEADEQAPPERPATSFWGQMRRDLRSGWQAGGGDSIKWRNFGWPFNTGPAKRLGGWLSSRWNAARQRQQAGQQVPQHGLLAQPTTRHGIYPQYDARTQWGQDPHADYLHVRRATEYFFSSRGCRPPFGEQEWDDLTRHVLEEIRQKRDPSVMLKHVLDQVRQRGA